MVFEVANPELARCLKNWAEQYGLTHLNSIPEEEPLTDLRSLDESFELAEIPFNPNYWACDWALSTLFFWDLLPVDDPRRSSSPPEWCPLLIDSPRAPEKTFTITATGWNSVLETETEYRKRIRGHLDNAITEYVRGVKKYLKPSGFTLRSCHTSDHVVWLALYQVLARPLAKVLEFERQTTPPLNETLFARA
jgi:hypothetical protein